MRTLAIGLAAALSSCSQPQEVETVDADNMNMIPVTAPALEAESAGGSAFEVPSDTRARYFLLSVAPGKEGNIIAITRREGPSGTSFSRREIDCDARTFRYIGEGDTLAKAKLPASNPGDMSPLVVGSISDVAVKFACAQ